MYVQFNCTREFACAQVTERGRNGETLTTDNSVNTNSSIIAEKYDVNRKCLTPAQTRENIKSDLDNSNERLRKK